jgi:hypothetical protein
VSTTDRHRVDRELVVLDGRQDNHLQEVAGAIRPDDEPAVGVFAGVFDGERMVEWRDGCPR